jgi:predicted amidophosphoribosyltransferase
MFERLLQALLPLPCPSCGVRDGAPCDRCVATFRAAPTLPTPAGLDSCVAVYAYEGAVRNVVLACKRSNAHALAGHMARSIVQFAGVDRRSVDVVTWVPTTHERVRQRGYDHAERIARHVAIALQLPCRPLLARSSGPMDHAATLLAAVAFRPIRALSGSVLLVDDVRTTGRSLSVAARALRDGGASNVVARTFAATPLSGRVEHKSRQPHALGV